MQQGVERLLRDKTRKPGKPHLPPETVQRVADLALGPAPGEKDLLDRTDASQGRRGQSLCEPAQLARRGIRGLPCSSEKLIIVGFGAALQYKALAI
jgi:hypothetical protein